MFAAGGKRMAQTARIQRTSTGPLKPFQSSPVHPSAVVGLLVLHSAKIVKRKLHPLCGFKAKLASW